MPSVTLKTECWPLTEPFSITGYTLSAIDTLYVELEQDGHVGRGEAAGVYYQNETAESMHQQAEAVRSALEQGVDRKSLLQLLPSGGARNAIDAALWDLEAKQSGRSVWDLAGIQPQPTTTLATVGVDRLEKMAQAALALHDYKQLKIKVDGHDPVARIRAVREVRPDAELVLDANQGWTFEQLCAVTPAMQELGVRMIEQPLPRGADAQLEGYRCPITLCADESCLDESELAQAVERYDMINIKLDKVGGLTAGLAMARQVRAMGKQLMVGNMAGTSLAMAPGLVLAQMCDLIDLDGPLGFVKDREHPFQYQNGQISELTPSLWG